MTLLPPVSLVLDISALAGSAPKEWREFSRVGSTIYVPQAVYEEMRLLFDRSPESGLEELARAFTHFYPTSGWKITDAHAHHAALAATGKALTRRARVSLAAARCAYATAQNFSNQLVVLVTSDQSMLANMQQMPCTNLAAINASTLLQWSRTGQRPEKINQQLQQLRTAHSLSSAVPARRPGQPQSPPARTSTATSVRSQPSRAMRSSSATVRSTVRSTPARSASRAKARPFLSMGWLSQLLSLAIALGGFALVAWLVWSLVTNPGLLPMLRQPLDPNETPAKKSP